MPAPDAPGRVGWLLGRLTSGLHGATTSLVVLCLGMVGAAFIIPSNPVGFPVSRFTSLDPAAPVRLVVPTLGIRAPVVPVRLDAASVLDPPQDPLLVGWWAGSAEPGRGTGQTVITGHTVHTGGGAMDTVDTLVPGQRVDLVTRKGTMRYSVTQVRIFDKDTVAENAVALFGQSGGEGRLVLVSCDEWNGTTYESNVVVFAEPLGQPVRRHEDDDGPALLAGS